MKTSKQTISEVGLLNAGYQQCKECKAWWRYRHQCMQVAPDEKSVVTEEKLQVTTKKAVRSMNKTEEKFLREVLSGRGFSSVHPQALVLEFPCGDAYRPDFLAISNTGQAFIYEVKARGWLRDPRSKAGIQKYRRAKEQFHHVKFALAVLEDSGKWTIEQ